MNILVNYTCPCSSVVERVTCNDKVLSSILSKGSAPFGVVVTYFLPRKCPGFDYRKVHLRKVALSTTTFYNFNPLNRFF